MNNKGQFKKGRAKTGGRKKDGEWVSYHNDGLTYIQLKLFIIKKN